LIAVPGQNAQSTYPNAPQTAIIAPGGRGVRGAARVRTAPGRRGPRV